MNLFANYLNIWLILIMKTKTLLLALVCLVSAFSVHAYELTINIKNVRSSRGNIKVALFDQARGFPGNNQAAVRTEIVEIVDLSAQVVFRGLTDGEYAVSLFHDENNNNRLDTRLRIPREPLGFSNNPRLTGRPSFSRCSFELNADQSVDVYLKSIL